MGLFPRHSEARALEYLQHFPVVVIQGAHQVGKSTFAGVLASQKESLQLTLDDAAVDRDRRTSAATGWQPCRSPRPGNCETTQPSALIQSRSATTGQWSEAPPASLATRIERTRTPSPLNT